MKRIYENCFIIAFIILSILSSKCDSQEFKIHVANRGKDFLESIKNACVTVHDMDDYQLCFNNKVHRKKNDYIKMSDGSLVKSLYKDTLVGPIIVTKFGSDSIDYGIAIMESSGFGAGGMILYYILLFKNNNGKAVQLSSEGLMDSISVHGRFKSLKVDGDTLIVHLDDNPPVTNVLLFHDNKFTLLKY